MDEPHPTGLKPTLRQMMILVAWAALMSAILRVLVRWQLLVGDVRLACLCIPTYFGLYPMPILAGLLWAFDRPGRVRTWYRSSAMIAASVVSGTAFALQDPICFALTGGPTMTYPMAPVVALICFGSGWMQWRAARPRACPTCGRCAMIPVARRLRPRARRLTYDGKQGWCAVCGATGTRDRPGEWSAAPVVE